MSDDGGDDGGHVTDAGDDGGHVTDVGDDGKAGRLDIFEEKAFPAIQTCFGVSNAAREDNRGSGDKEGRREMMVIQILLIRGC